LIFFHLSCEVVLPLVLLRLLIALLLLVQLRLPRLLIVGVSMLIRASLRRGTEGTGVSVELC
jgi:hypothetical protein